ncbi:hypothetical protein LEP1GSC151_3599 [Leptospira interrogans serovar Grippotyphosa str. LT2186]|uniref:Uncharacterized protein n=3 Tax=Leptospiraceae TaxID=170 RepID=M3FMZ8_LEPIR|nr:hypothetical protein [Leptospira interrogans]EKP85276.1 hypothetical protein LEP1GSC020_3795 [Leptospira interrogans serovar Grippotyphosa str. 2006006986]EMG08834.1 hypothetical protein LEP1GSC151_3599 [Leptospira interrogans serovar Grippotyphosa str. LT2186]EMN85459.1 hypothetical protein LEP1GSC107_2435 [Leptospira interrogans serovar Grippotyphosa str. UI 12769]AJR14765.1 hypothetical protein LIL_12163 [Leptospira interrogans serovar Linhai str. 56609]EKO85454.1 hypothetical protein LE
MEISIDYFRILTNYDDMGNEAVEDIKKETIKGLIRPFSERFNHPILSWVIVFSVYFHISKIAKFILFLNDLYQPPAGKSILEDIGSEITFCNLISPIILGTAVGFLFPLFDAAFSKWVACVQRIRANWVSDELQRVYKTNIQFLDTTLRSVLEIIENPLQHDILQQLDKNVINTLRVVRGVKTLELGQCVKLNNEEGIIYPCQVMNDSSYGIVVKILNNDLYIVLQSGKINNEQLKEKFTQNGPYVLSDGKWKPESSPNAVWLAREDDWVRVAISSNLSDSPERRFRRFHE